MGEGGYVLKDGGVRAIGRVEGGQAGTEHGGTSRQWTEETSRRVRIERSSSLGSWVMAYLEEKSR
jgi:hypothetical protein